MESTTQSSTRGAKPKFPDTDPDLVPPRELVTDGKGGLSSEKWVTHGQNFVRTFLMQRCGIKPHESVLDVGCGIGNKAMVLASYLDERASYEGFDVLPEAIEWCAKAYAGYPNFSFRTVDIFSKHYNENGKETAETFRFPYEDESFDIVILASVFTHILPDGVINYLNEVARVLRPGGRTVITYFLLNRESEAASQVGEPTIPITHETGQHGSRVRNPAVPEETVGHQEEFIRQLYTQVGLTITDLGYGFWCGRKDHLNRLQDTIISVK